MANFPIESFHGGIIDEIDDCPPHYAKRMRNLLVDKNGKPYCRDGVQAWSNVAITTLERVRGVKVISSPGGLGTRQAFVFSKHKIWVSDTVTELSGPDTLTEVTSDAASPKSLSASTGNASGMYPKFQLASNHLYASFWSTGRNQFGTVHYTTSAYHPRPKKIYPNDIAAGTWFAANVGLPQYTGLPSDTKNPGAESYIYYFVYCHTYSIGGTEYVVLGTPSAPFTVSSAAVIAPGNEVDFTGFDPPFESPVDQCYALASMTIRIYRTKTGETLPRYVDEIDVTTDTFSDDVTDANLGAPLYTSDGSSPYDEPPPCKVMHIVGDTSYFGGFNIPSATFALDNDGLMAVIQGVPGVIDSAPADYLIPTPDHVVAIENVDNWPIFFCRTSCWRVEGQIDSFGNGSPVLKAISERIGALHPGGVIKTDRGIVFASMDGYYITDGFSAIKLTDHCNKFYARMWGRSDENYFEDYAAMISSAYHPKSKKVFFAGCSQDFNYQSAANAIHVLDLDKGGQQACVTEFVGADTPPTNQYTQAFIPTALELVDDSLLIGDINGNVTKIDLEPETPTHTDTVSQLLIAQADWEEIAVVWDYISPAFSMGNKWAKKWGTWLTVMFKLAFDQIKIYAQIFAYNDIKFRSDALYDGLELAPVREEDLEPEEQIKTIDRRFKRPGRRFKFKQIQIKKGFVVLYASHPDDEEVYPEGTLVKADATFQLGGGRHWPTGIIWQRLYFEKDNYANGWSILTAGGDTLTLYDPNSTLPVDGDYKWMIKGYSKDHGSGLGFEGINIQYEPMGEMNDRFKATDSGSNDVVGS